MRTTIEFGGFYHSVHEQLVESAVEMYCMDENGNIDEGMMEDWDWGDSHFNYMREWLRIFEEWLKDEYNIDITFKHYELISPKFYNFRTDTINADLTEREVTDLLDKFDNDQNFLDYLRQATKSYDGYTSFYTFEQARENKDNVLDLYLLRYLADKFNDNELFNYYDRNNCYERIA